MDYGIYINLFIIFIIFYYCNKYIQNRNKESVNKQNINKYAVYTVITGKDKIYDKIHAQDKNFKENNIDYYLFTNNKFVSSNFFKVMYVDSPLSDKILSRDIKINVHKYLPNYEKTLYIDGNVKIKNHLKLLFLNMKSDIETYEIDRNMIEEMEWIHKNKYCSKKILMNKLRKYKNDGFDIEKNKILYGKIILRKNIPEMKYFQKLWFHEYKDILRDQLSLPYCIWKYNISHTSLGEGPFEKNNKHFLTYFKNLVKHNK